MISSLGLHLNNILLVSIPSLFKDDHLHACTLTGIDAAGVWLEGAELAKKALRADDKRDAVSIFIPFAQIAYMLEPGEAKHPKPAPDREIHHADAKEKRGKDDARKKNHR